MCQLTGKSGEGKKCGGPKPQGRPLDVHSAVLERVEDGPAELEGIWGGGGGRRALSHAIPPTHHKTSNSFKTPGLLGQRLIPQLRQQISILATLATCGSGRS